MKKLIFTILGFLLLLPWGINYMDISPNLFMESQDELNVSNLYSHMLNLEPVYRYGKYTYSGYVWIFYLTPKYILSLIFGNTSGLIYIAGFLLLGFVFMYRLLMNFFLDKSNKYNWLIAISLSFIYYTSPSIFFYFQSTIALTLPAIIFPVQLYFLFLFLENLKRRYIFVLLISFLLIAFCNLTSLILNIGFLILVAWIYFGKFFLRTILAVSLSVLPTIVFLVVILFASFELNYSNTTQVLNAVKEDFYSINNTIINIFKQTADWGFFGGFDYKLYYQFSEYYSKYFIQGIGYLFFVGSILVIAFSKNKRKSTWLALIIFVVFFMLGNRNPIFDYLYDHFAPFQIFRNIQKFAPFLLLFVLFGLAFSVNKSNYKYIIVFLLFGFIYNTPYFLYKKTFIGDRNVSEISDSWKQTSIFLDQNLDKNNTKILSLPATYINEYYPFGSGNVLVAVLTDYVTNIKIQRLSPILSGDIYTQKGMGELFIDDSSSLYGKTIDIPKLKNFLHKFHYTHVLVTSDMIRKYESSTIYVDVFGNDDDFKKVYQNKDHTIFEYKDNLPILYAPNLEFSKGNFGIYRLSFNGSSIFNISSLEPYHLGWKLYLEPFTPLDCNSGSSSYTGTIDVPTGQMNSGVIYIVKSRDDYTQIALAHTGLTVSRLEELNPDIDPLDLKIGMELIIGDPTPVTRTEPYDVTDCSSDDGSLSIIDGLSRLWEKPIFSGTHKMIYDYANQWTIDPEYIRTHYSREYYRMNPDGTMDVRMTLFFRPQAYFYVGLIISGLTLFGCIGYLISSSIRRRRRVHTH